MNEEAPPSGELDGAVVGSDVIGAVDCTCGLSGCDLVERRGGVRGERLIQPSAKSRHKRLPAPGDHLPSACRCDDVRRPRSVVSRDDAIANFRRINLRSHLAPDGPTRRLLVFEGINDVTRYDPVLAIDVEGSDIVSTEFVYRRLIEVHVLDLD